MRSLLAALALVFSLTACGGSSDAPEPKAPAADTSLPTTETPAAPKIDWAGRITKWEKENAVVRADYLVTGADVDGATLTVQTSIFPDAEGKAAAKNVCGAYSTFTLDYPKITSVSVLGKNGDPLATCGPGA